MEPDINGIERITFTPVAGGYIEVLYHGHTKLVDEVYVAPVLDDDGEEVPVIIPPKLTIEE